MSKLQMKLEVKIAILSKPEENAVKFCRVQVSIYFRPFCWRRVAANLT